MFARGISAAGVPACTPDQQLGYSPSAEEVAAHRQFSLPTISYPFGTKIHSYEGGMEVLLHIDVNGNVACVSPHDRFEKQVVLTKERQRMLDEIGTWHYVGFNHSGSPTEAIVSEIIAEQELPQSSAAVPVVPLERVHFSLDRTGATEHVRAIRSISTVTDTQFTKAMSSWTLSESIHSALRRSASQSLSRC